MLTDTWADGFETNVVFATSAEWVCLFIYFFTTLVCGVLYVAVILAASRYRDSVRSSARLQFLLGLKNDYCVLLQPKPAHAHDGV
jgi:hypothetical protein